MKVINSVALTVLFLANLTIAGGQSQAMAQEATPPKVITPTSDQDIHHQDPEAQDESTGLAMDLAVDLFANTAGQPSGKCDRILTLQISSDEGQPIAQVANAVRGRCRLGVIPRPRTFSLQASADTCGVYTYTGTSQDRRHQAVRVVISDYRFATCTSSADPESPALIIYREFPDPTADTNPRRIMYGQP